MAEGIAGVTTSVNVAEVEEAVISLTAAVVIISVVAGVVFFREEVESEVTGLAVAISEGISVEVVFDNHKKNNNNINILLILYIYIC